MGRTSLFAREAAFDRRATEPGGAETGPEVALESERPLARAWVVVTVLQAAIVVAFASLFVFELDGRRFWAVSDDIYISACYARNIAAGNGPVWFPGADRVEGFSNPLWTGILVVVHALPFFREQDLGAYVLALQLAIVAGAMAAAFSVVRAMLALAGGAVDLRPLRLAAIVAISLGWASLGFWLAEGFEIGLVLLFALIAFRCSLAPPSARRAAAIGALAGLAFWARMDGPLVVRGSVLVRRVSRFQSGTSIDDRSGRWTRSHLAIAVGVLAAFMASQFLARRAVFGEWFPNTYWLKLEGWPLAERVADGLRRNLAEIPALALAWVLLLLPATRAALGAALRPARALLATASALVAYSIHNGGDSWMLRLGFDRFGAPGAVLLGIALAVYLLRVGRTDGAVLGAAAAALAIALSPALLDPSLTFVARLVLGKFAVTEKTYIGYGRAFEECSRPARRSRSERPARSCTSRTAAGTTSSGSATPGSRGSRSTTRRRRRVTTSAT
jgi:hypothetical protein